MNDSCKLDLPGGGSCDCAIRLSSRCRSASLRLSARRGLELVIPPRHPISKALAFAAKNAAWVERILARHELRKKAAQARPDSNLPLPQNLLLKAIGEELPIDYIDSQKLDFVSVRIDTPGRLTVQGDLQDIRQCRDALKDWLRARALKLFINRTAELSAECGLKYESVKVRDQRGRWGSCSHRGRINLNFRLLLMEDRFLRHVIIHELCHTSELNHSDRFWNIVERFEPNAKMTKAALRKAALELPAWLSDEMEL